MASSITLRLLPLLALLSQSQAQSAQYPFGIQVATAKTPSLVNQFVDQGNITDPQTEFIISNGMTPTEYNILNKDDPAQAATLMDLNNMSAVERQVQNSTTHLSGITVQDQGRPIQCVITGHSLQCEQGKFNTSVACSINGMEKVFLATPNSKLPSGCEVITLKTITIG